VNFLDNSAPKVQLFENYENILNKIDEKTLVINKFKEAPELLQVIKTELLQKHYLKFDSLRSNCRVTHQPDFGDIFIYYKSKNLIDYSSLVKYLSSFRSEYHFHEECCEIVFKRIFDLLNKEDELFVCALYTRRGGIDITPVRWSNGFEPVEAEILSDISKFVRSGIKQ
jgi:7-cyano-7-deazaguanine reductase